MNVQCSTSRQAGDKLIIAQAQRQVQTFFDEIKNGTQNYRTIASLDAQIAQAYRGRCILELLQNAHDALKAAPSGDPRQVSFVLNTSSRPVLLIGNAGTSFHPENFAGLCQLGQSPKDPNQSVGNKGLGFRSVLEVSTSPEIWSTAPIGSQTSFVFRFDPAVADRVAAAARELEEMGLDARSPFNSARPLLDWSQEQLAQYHNRITDAGLDCAREASEFLSPYLIPLPVRGMPPEVESLLGQGHVTVIRLPLDGGGAGTPDEAVQSVKEQLDALDARAAVFLSRAEKLVIDIDGEHRILERVVESEHEFSAFPRSRRQRLLVGQSEPASDEHSTREFQVWTRAIGGDDDPDQADRVRSVVANLPNRWPEVRRVVVGVAVEEAPSPDKGLFVIFLPTEMATGTGAHINAPFYSSLDRRHIDFGIPYNDLLLKCVLDLCLDAVADLVSDEPEEWRARAVVDLVSSPASVDGGEWRVMDALFDRASNRDLALQDCRLLLCDDGWCAPGTAREMPEVADNISIGPEHWRTHAAFSVVSKALVGRRSAVRELVKKLDGSLNPTHSEWLQTIDRVAISVRELEIDVGWDAFLNSVVGLLPTDMRSEPKAGTPDPLAAARFLPDQVGRLLSISDSAKLFFQPVRGLHDAADLVGHVPESLKHRVAFLHPDVQTQQGQPRRNTVVQKFLDGRFARGFRREDILREVVLPAVPALPAAHGGNHAELCSDLFAWTLQLLGEDPSDALLSLFSRLPVACHEGWLALGDAVFGPGWPSRLGDDVWLLAKELPQDAAARLRGTTLLPPDDPRWGRAVEHLDPVFARVGVVDGLRLRSASGINFHMQGSDYELPSTSPPEVPQQAWDDWRRSVREEAHPYYTGYFAYSLSGITLLPEIHHLEALSRQGRNALSRLLLASIPHWPRNWHKASIKKQDGLNWSTSITSPLRHWLTTKPWLLDGTAATTALPDRWLIPTSLLRGQRDRYRHLNSLSLDLSRRLETDPELKSPLTVLGLNVYPVEDDRIGPELLDALASAWNTGRVSVGRFDVLLGQVRDGWRHLDPQKGFPETLLVRTGHRTFSTRGQDELRGVYLPDSRDRTRSLLAHGQHILEMNAREAGRVANALESATDIRRSSALTERVLLDGRPWTGAAGELPTLEASAYAWLPVTLLAIAAYGGAEPTGASTKRWRDAAHRLRRAHIAICETISVQLVDGDEIVAKSQPRAEWLPADVLAIRRDLELTHEDLAAAAQRILDRQDLLKDLRLVLGSLSGQEKPTFKQIEAALERAEIDAQAFADIQNRWAGTLSLLVDRIRPVLKLLGICLDGFDAAASDLESLAGWLSSNVSQWSSRDLLSAARKCRDDHEMGLNAWHALGDAAQLPAWNSALATLGDRYDTVQNHAARDQTGALIESAMPLLRCFARHIAIKEDDPSLFHDLEAVTQNFQMRDDWSTRWWEVPFTAVLEELQADYAQVPSVARHLKVLKKAQNVDDLKTVLHDFGISTDCNPYQIARRNMNRLQSLLYELHDLHRTWVELTVGDPAAPERPQLPADVDPAAYLNLWSDAELLRRTLRCIGKTAFTEACAGCASLGDIRSQLALDPDAVAARRRERQEQDREKQRQTRTFDVAGIPFEVGTTSVRDLFDHLNGLAAPVGPRASRDSFTALTTPPPGVRSPGGGGTKGKTSHLRPTRDLRELVGIVGEIHAYRYLRQEFGSETVTPDSWVSEIRQLVLPLVPGEPDDTSDSHGFDFRFSQGRRRWHVEVKATTGDDPQFELGITEIEAATLFARRRGGRWRILRVRNALSDEPEFDWLPNPFQDGFKDRFRLQGGGMRVSYARKKP